MNETTGQTMDWSPGTREAQMRQKFIDAWQRALEGGDPPTVSEILSELLDPENLEFRRDLESIEALFRQRLSGTGNQPAGSSAGATINLERRGDATIGHAEAGKPRETAVHDTASGLDGPATMNHGSAAVEHANDMTVTAIFQGGKPFAADDPNLETRAFLGDDTPLVRPGKRGAPILVPKTVAGYEILGVLGRGGMGVVYQARQPGLKRLVALKMILAGGHASDDDLARFRSEAEAVALLQHPNIVQIYEIGEDDGRPYFSLEFIDGESLASKLEGKPQTPRQAAEIIHVLAQAMAVAHARGIVHRDLKPANILVAKDGTPKITDFGLAKRLKNDDGGQTRSGSILGTPDYMSPEQAAGRTGEVGPAADIYALGAMLYEMLAGRVPLRGASVLDTLQQVVAKEPVAPTQLEPKVPRDLETICLKCLRKDPSKRYARIDDLAEDLRRFLAGEPILARPVAAPERLWRWCKRNPRVAALSAALAVLVMIWAATASAAAWRLKLEKDATAAAKELAEKNERIAKLQETEAKHLATIANEQAKRAETNAQNAIASTAEANVNLKAAKKQNELAVELLLGLGEQLEKRLQEKRGLKEPAELRAMHADIANLVGQAMTKLSKHLEESKVPSFAMVNASNQLGELLFKFGHAEEALRQFQSGYKTVSQILEAQPDDEYARANSALMLMQMGKMYLEINDDAKTAREMFVKAHDLHQSLVDEPRSQSNLSQADHKRLRSHYELYTGIADLHLGRPADAVKSLNEALSHRDAWLKLEPNNVSARSYLSEAHYYLGVASWHVNDLEATQDHFRKALTICHELAATFPSDFSFQLDLAELYGAYCDAKLRLGKADDARIAAAKSLEYIQAVLAHDPDFVSRQALLALTYERQALVAARRGESEESRQRFNDARKLRDDLVLVEPNNQSWQMARALTLAHCGDHAEAAKKAQEVIDKSPENIGLLLQAARCWAVCAADTADADGKQAYRQRAIEALRKATGGEYRDSVLLTTDPELVLLADDADFAAMLAEIKARSGA